MKDERAKYLLVNATNIIKQLYRVEREAYCNDFDNIYHIAGKIDANEIFAKNNVPDEFRRIIIKISSPIFSRKEAEEYITRYPFNLQAKSIEKIDNKKYIIMNNRPIYYDGCMFNDKFVFKTEERYTSINNVMYFLEEIHKEGYLENYLQSIKEFFNLPYFFNMPLDFQLLFEYWNQTHNTKKTLALYKHKIIGERIID